MGKPLSLPFAFYVLLIRVLLSTLAHGTAFSMDGLAHQLAVICCTVHSCIHELCMENLLFTRSAHNVVDSCVCDRLSDEQIQTASLLQECIMVRDGLARLPDVSTVSDIVRYLCTC